MSFEPEFLEMMPHTIQVRSKTGKDHNDQPTFGATRSYPARVTGKLMSLRRDATQDVTYVYDIYVHCGNDVLTTEDEFTLPSDPVWGITHPQVFAVARISDEDGNHHAKVQCGWQYHRQGQ